MAKLIDNEKIVYKEEDEISLREFLLKLGNWWRYLLSKWKVVVSVSLLGGILGFAVGYIKKPVYKATLSFVLDEQKAGGGMGQVSGLASLVGINLGGMEGAGLFTGDNIMEFIKSKRMIKKTLLTRAYFEDGEELLVERYVKTNKLDGGWQEHPLLKGFKFVPDTSFFLQDSLLGEYYRIIVKNNLSIGKVDKNLSVLQLDIKSYDEQFAKVFCEALIQNVTDFYVETRTKKSVDNLSVLSRQVDSIRRELNDAIGGMASASDANPNANVAFQRLRVPSQKRQIDVQANTAILSELVKQQEIARLNVRNDKPLIQSLDRPTLPLDKENLGMKKGFIVGGFVFGFLCVLYLMIRRLIQEIIAGGDMGKALLQTDKSHNPS